MHAAPDPRGVRGVVAEEVGRVLQPTVLRHYHLRRSRDFHETGDACSSRQKKRVGYGPYRPSVTRHMKTDVARILLPLILQ